MESVDNQQKQKITIRYYNTEKGGVEVEIGQGSDDKQVSKNQIELPTIQI